MLTDRRDVLGRFADPVYGEAALTESLLLALLRTAPVRRLRGIHQAGASYLVRPGRDVTRYEHAVGVMLLIRRLGGSVEEQAAGLIHDVSHTAFSHVADHLFGRRGEDYHEAHFERLVLRSEIPGVLAGYGLRAAPLLDHSRWGLLERPLPDLCADRLDYTLRDLLRLGAITPAEEKPTALAIEQLKALVAARPVAQRGEVPLVLFDAGYDACGFTDALAGTPVSLLIRLRSNRHFWFAPTRTTARPRGRPKRHGAKFVCNDPATWPAPTAELHVTDEAYGHVQVQAWAGLRTYVRRPVRPGVVGQYRGPRRLTHGTAVRLEVGRLPGQRRTPAVVWLW